MIVRQVQTIAASESVATVDYVLFGITSLLVVLALLMLVEAIRALLPGRPTTNGPNAPATAAATA